MLLINIGCGSTFHPDWVNFDADPVSPLVKKLDLRRGLPFPGSSVHAVYSSHVIEHLDTNQCRYFLTEVLRVLKHGCVLRLATPDLETIARSYLLHLDRMLSGDIRAESKYDWIMLEMYDQCVRRQSGGEIAQHLKSVEPADREFIISRIGTEAIRYWRDFSSPPKTFFQRLRSKNRSWYLNKAKTTFAELLLVLFAGRDAVHNFREGEFRNSGEIHRWMYDRFSLRRMMERAGFTNVKTFSAFESQITNFCSYQLDTLDGAVRKPDSFYMEGIKP